TRLFAHSTSPSHPPRIEYRLLAGAVAPKRALLADRVRPLEDPVLPGGEASKYFRFHGFRTAEAKVGLEPGQRVRREARALLEEHADLVFPVDVVECEGDEAQSLRGLRIKPLADRGLRPLELGGIGEKAAREPREPVRHRIGAEIHFPEGERGGGL